MVQVPGGHCALDFLCAVLDVNFAGPQPRFQKEFAERLIAKVGDKQCPAALSRTHYIVATARGGSTNHRFSASENRPAQVIPAVFKDAF